MKTHEIADFESADDRPESGRSSGLLARLRAPIGAAAAVLARQLNLQPGASNVLEHGSAEAVGQAANVLSHQGGAAVAGGATAAGAAAAAASGGTGTAATGGAGASAAGASGSGGASSSAIGMSGQAVAASAASVAVVAAVVAGVIATRDSEPEAAPPIPETTAAPVPAEQPTAGPGRFEVVGTDTTIGNLIIDANPGTGSDPIVVVAVAGDAEAIGVPVGLPSGATVVVEADGSFRYEPGAAFTDLAAGESAEDGFAYSVSRADGWAAEWTATLSIEGVNDEPLLDPAPPVSVVEGQVTSVTLSATDPDSEGLGYRLSESAPSFVSLAPAGDGTAVLTVEPGPGDAGVHEFTVSVDDDGTPPQSHSVTVTITVAPAAVDPPPVAARVTDGLAAFYDFEEESGSVAADTSGVGSPTDLVVSNPDAVRWSDGTLTVTAPTLVSSAGPAGALSQSISAAGQLTVEAWVTPASADQSGPARVVSLSSGILLRNVMLGQGDPDGVGGDHWTARLRTTTRSDNGLPALTTPAGSVGTGAASHLVVTRSATGELSFYVDGTVVAAGTADGELTNWDDGFHLMLANESSGGRPWLGTYHLVAVYARALSAAEVTQNHQVGP